MNGFLVGYFLVRYCEIFDNPSGSTSRNAFYNVPIITFIRLNAAN